MREIKLQFWDELNKKMWIANEAGETVNGWTLQYFADNHNLLQGIIYRTIDVGFGPNDGPTDERVLPCRQFTGLSDKNGVEIYEGDIVEERWLNPLAGGENVDRYKIGFFENGTYKMYHSSGEKRWDRMLFLRFREVEIIGNIYENPELLKGENQ